MTTTRIDLIEELRWRGLLHQCTDEAGLRDHLADPDNNPRKVYIGFDPTAPSLTIGNLVQIMNLARVRQAGHIPVVVMGGGTGLIGDPSGKSAERTLMTYETVQEHIRRQQPIFDAVLGVKDRDYLLRNNADWLMKISYLDALRDIGKFFSVNMMMQKESVKARLENREQGISYTEFSYMILQAYDFAHLYEHEGVTVQGGGSDQFGNIVAGSDLIRRMRASIVAEVLGIAKQMHNSVESQSLQEFDAAYVSNVEQYFSTTKQSNSSELSAEEYAAAFIEPLEAWAKNPVWPLDIRNRCSELAAKLRSFFQSVFGLTAPLVTKADGGKFGKTESGAIWLTADRTSPYAYYQFWLNASDADAANWIKVFTFLDQPTIESIIARHAENPGARELQRTLAQEATRILHGQSAMEQAEAAGKALFSGDISSLDEATLREVLADVPSSEKDRADLASGCDAVDLLVETALAKSKREAREFIANGSVAVNGHKLAPDTPLTQAHLLHGSLMAIRRGKKNWHLIRWS